MLLCFYAFRDEKTGLFWMIPFSSQIGKFRGYYNFKIQRYGKCDTIAFGEVLGYEKAFLIQNMCPVTEKYIKNEDNIDVERLFYIYLKLKLSFMIYNNIYFHFMQY